MQMIIDQQMFVDRLSHHRPPHYYRHYHHHHRYGSLLVSCVTLWQMFCVLSPPGCLFYLTSTIYSVATLLLFFSVNLSLLLCLTWPVQVVAFNRHWISLIMCVFCCIHDVLLVSMCYPDFLLFSCNASIFLLSCNTLTFFTRFHVIFWFFRVFM